MLNRARSMWLSVIIGTQYPYQIQRDFDQVYRALNNNANTLIACKTPGDKDARLLMKRFNDHNAGDLINTDRYRAWTTIPLPDGEQDEPVNFQMFAPYPPLRSEDDAIGVIRNSLDTYGTYPLTDDEIQRELKYGDFAEVMAPDEVPTADVNPDKGAAIDNAPDADMLNEENLPESTKRLILEGVYAALISDGNPSEPVAVSKAKAEIIKRVGDTGYQSILSNIFERLPEIRFEGRGDGEGQISLTQRAINEVLAADTGKSASGGGYDHRLILQKSFISFTKLGAVTTLPTQEGDALPDGLAELPIDPLDADTPAEFHEREDTLKEKYPTLYDLSHGRDIAIEAETSTIKKPKQTLKNLGKAIATESLCVFACKDASGDDNDSRDITYWPRRGERILYDTDGNSIDYDTLTCAREMDDNGNRIFYNRSSKYEMMPDVYAVRDADDSDELIWRETGTGGILVETDSGSRLGQFDSPANVADPDRRDVRAYREQNDDGEWVVRVGGNQHGPYATLGELRDDWQDLYAPFIPENEFDREPREEDFCFVVFPDDDNGNYTGPQYYEQGDLDPLFDDEENPLAELTTIDSTDAESNSESGGDSDATPESEPSPTDTEQETAPASADSDSDNPTDEQTDTEDSTQGSKQNGHQQTTDTSTETDTDEADSSSSTDDSPSADEKGFTHI